MSRSATVLSIDTPGRARPLPAIHTPRIEDLGVLLEIDEAIATFPEKMRPTREWALANFRPIVKFGRMRGIYEKDLERWKQSRRVDQDDTPLD
jgi:hypothetical protein